MDIKFSVSICVYGGDTPEYFDEAMNSIFNQSLLPNEVVLVVDGPVCPKIDHVIQKYQVMTDDLKVIRLEKNSGHGIARNIGIKNCSYPYIAIADADDINRKDRFEKQIQCFLKNPQLSAVSSGCYHFSKSVEEIDNEEIFPISNHDIREYMKTRCPLCQASAMLKKVDVEAAGGYRDWYHAEDYYLWIRMYLNGAIFENIPENLLYVRSDPAQMNRRGGMKYFLSLKKLYRYMLKNNVINIPTYIFNVSSRFALQVLMPDRVRGYVRKKLL